MNIQTKELWSLERCWGDVDASVIQGTLVPQVVSAGCGSVWQKGWVRQIRARAHPCLGPTLHRLAWRRLRSPSHHPHGNRLKHLHHAQITISRNQSGKVTARVAFYPPSSTAAYPSERFLLNFPVITCGAATLHSQSPGQSTGAVNRQSRSATDGLNIQPFLTYLTGPLPPKSRKLRNFNR